MVELAVVIDCEDAEALSRFWTVALGYEHFGHVGPYRSIRPPEGEAGPKVIFQVVPEAKGSKNRLHLDLFVVDIEAEVSRLVEVGAARLTGLVVENGSSWVLMKDPEGNEFCICGA